MFPFPPRDEIPQGIREVADAAPHAGRGAEHRDEAVQVETAFAVSKSVCKEAEFDQESQRDDKPREEDGGISE